MITEQKLNNLEKLDSLETKLQSMAGDKKSKTMKARTTRGILVVQDT